ncbi:hypothetical protein F2P81_019283 [Scophthalmus maximus]|uniref:Uncharacterized protein n=1 Tax=Scophthalmus maximus TaxID=52904 RepID=A0A6A4RZ80_SCOMX|nr:hypothetical protein F2P81_019283 [Scophthalmus maximus]
MNFRDASLSLPGERSRRSLLIQRRGGDIGVTSDSALCAKSVSSSGSRCDTDSERLLSRHSPPRLSFQGLVVCYIIIPPPCKPTSYVTLDFLPGKPSKLASLRRPRSSDLFGEGQKYSVSENNVKTCFTHENTQQHMCFKCTTRFVALDSGILSTYILYSVPLLQCKVKGSVAEDKIGLEVFRRAKVPNIFIVHNHSNIYF